jgi:DNA-binding response OmpR family regulator
MTRFNTPLGSYLPTLIVDANGEAANQLTDQLRHGGFPTKFATSYYAALDAVRAAHYGVLVVVADLTQAADLQCLTDLRKWTPRAWIIVISPKPHPNARHVVFECGADSVLIVPFSLGELISRLSAFSLRARPP